jgi:hypothetical protein
VFVLLLKNIVACFQIHPLHFLVNIGPTRLVHFSGLIIYLLLVGVICFDVVWFVFHDDVVENVKDIFVLKPKKGSRVEVMRQKFSWAAEKVLFVCLASILGYMVRRRAHTCSHTSWDNSGYALSSIVSKVLCACACLCMCFICTYRRWC